MELSLYTDSVPNLSLDEALDYAAGLGIKAVEIAAGGQSSAPHMRVFDLLDDPSALKAFAEKLTSRGIRMAAVNCSAWPLHPRYGEAHTRTIQAAIRLAGELGVQKIVTMSGCPGDSPTSSIVNWITFPWPAQNPADPSGADIAAVLEQQWEQAIAYWQDMAAFAGRYGVRTIALELHPVHLVYNTPTLLRMRDAVGPIIGANVDPSHMFWQQMDPVKVVQALGSAVHHVHLKDTSFNPEALALTGVLELNPFEGDPAQRAWNFTTIGQGHGDEFWSPFVDALRAVGYNDVLSIENEDPTQPREAGVTQAAEFVSRLL
jgi:sugar phosphate isomerase/epimerase